MLIRGNFEDDCGAISLYPAYEYGNDIYEGDSELYKGAL